MCAFEIFEKGGTEKNGSKLHMSQKFKLVGEENCKYIFLLGRFALLAYTIAIIESDK